ncbi:hypothetical protein ACOME3_005074 [Neoechinorhynchus agilis]
MVSRGSGNSDINQAINGFVEDEVNILERMFKMEPMPTTLDLARIAVGMRRTLFSIENWFRHRRRQQIREINGSIGTRTESAVPFVQDRDIFTAYVINALPRLNRFADSANPYRLYLPPRPEGWGAIQPGELFRQYEGVQMDDSESEED